MKKALLAVAALTCMGSAALAGPNAGGTLIAALSEGTVYTTDNTGYCGSVTAGDCASAVPSVSGGTAVINILAAFTGSPRLAGLTFGWTYPADIAIAEAASCGDFELPNSDWPASGSGTAVTWSTAQTSLLVEVYWAAAYSYYDAPAQLTLGPHPTQGGKFADDDVPANIDDIAAFGVFGFATVGNAPCPGEAPGACCFADGSCEVLLRTECDAAGGAFLGEGIPCDPNMCPQPPEGACCIGADCVVLTEQECIDRGGEYKGDDVPCTDGLCGGTPVIESTWGQIKDNYR
jgi:hypothetical protein